MTDSAPIVATLCDKWLVTFIHGSYKAQFEADSWEDAREALALEIPPSALNRLDVPPQPLMSWYAAGTDGAGYWRAIASPPFVTLGDGQ